MVVIVERVVVGLMWFRSPARAASVDRHLKAQGFHQRRFPSVRADDPEIAGVLPVARESDALRVGRPIRIPVLGLWRAGEVEHVTGRRIGDEHLGVAGAYGGDEEVVAVVLMNALSPPAASTETS